MFTIFTIPKGFKGGHTDIIQKNAIKSWTKLLPAAEVILFGDDPGVAEAAKEFNVKHISEIEKNNLGTPILSSVLELAQKIAKNQLLVYLNADIILLSDFIPAIKKINKPLFFVSGQRWDLDVKELINFNNPDWEKNLRNKIIKEGKRHGPLGMDYFVFSHDFKHNMPKFPVGRPGWDNWLIYQVRSLKIPLIDATEAITVIHQNHDYSHSKHGGKKRVAGPEFKEAIKMAGGFSHMLTMRDADWVLNTEGLKRPKFPGRIFSMLSLFYPWRFLLSFKRKMQQFLQ